MASYRANVKRICFRRIIGEAQDQHLLLDEHGFGHHGPGAAGTGEAGDCRQQMQKKDGQIAHRTMLPSWRHRRRMLGDLEFAMHRSRIATSADHYA
jgi:hypothetical protein